VWFFHPDLGFLELKAIAEHTHLVDIGRLEFAGSKGQEPVRASREQVCLAVGSGLAPPIGVGKLC
jgi:hypothetical protein